MTEDEAKKKWCPHVRGGERTFTGGTLSKEVRCLASGCARWESGRYYKSMGEDIYNAHGDKTAAETNTEVIGYCGVKQ